MLILIGVLAGLTYCGFLVYAAFPADGYGATTVVSDMEAEGAPYSALLRTLDAVSAVLTLLLAPYLWWALPRGIWRQVAVWSLVAFGVFGIPAGVVPLSCAEGSTGCPNGTADGLQSLAHDAASIISTGALIASAGATALAVRRTGPRWLVWAGWVTVAIQVVSGLLVGAGEVIEDLGPMGAISQRVEIVGIAAWVVCVGVYAASHGVRAAPWARERDSVLRGPPAGAEARGPRRSGPGPDRRYHC